MRVAILCFYLASCAASTPVEQYEESTAPIALTSEQRRVIAEAHPSLNKKLITVALDDQRNQVLNLMELGKAAMLVEDINTAKDAFDRALLEIETIYGFDKNAEEARSFWYSEGRKSFKGEPYERVMAYLYRGILYLYEGDYGNARASFEGGILQDAFAEEEQYRADFSVLHALSYWAAVKYDQYDLAQLSSDEFSELKPDISLPESDHNVLIIAETGYSPRKLSDGLGHTALVYRRGKNFRDASINVVFDDPSENVTLVPVEDLYFQASTRGGRYVKKILDGKLQFQQSSTNTAAGLASAGNIAAEATRGSTTNQSSIGRYVSATKALSALALGIGAKVKPQADIRYWSSLPDTLHIGFVSLPEATESATAHYFSAQGTPLAGLSKKANIHFDKNNNGIIWIGRTIEGEQKQ